MANPMLMRWSKLYSNQTPAEKSLEPAIAALGQPYRSQHPLWALGLFPDFVLTRQRIVIEVDDPSHSTKAAKLKDAERTLKLARAGWKVVRCLNAEAIADPIGTVKRLCQEAGHPELITKRP